MAAETVTLTMDASHADLPWQIVDAQQRILKSCKVQGDAISWLLGEGYQWVTDTQQPQQWLKP